MFWRKPRRLDEITSPLKVESLKKLARIVVVDDDPASVPTESLRANGYSVEYWELLDATRLSRLEKGEFDIIVLDIQGIVSHGLSDTDDGLGILRRLKRANPAQIVIACSGQSYTIDKMEFYRIADATMAKPISLVRAMATLDEVLTSKIGALNYWKHMSDMLRESGVAGSRIQRLEDEIVRSVESGRGVSAAKVSEIVGHLSTAATITELVAKVVMYAAGKSL